MPNYLVQHYRSGERWEIETAGDSILQITRLFRESSQSERPAEFWLAPPLVDMQINGRAGIDFLSPEISLEQIESLVRGWDDDGVGHGLATVTTQSSHRIHHALEKIWRATEQLPEVAARIAGIHLEGPYLSPLDGPRGAHPLEHIRPPDWDEFQQFQQSAGGLIRLLTLSPEHAGSAKFIRQVVSTGVHVSIGHSAANREQILAAVDAGASLSTHLGNGCHGQIDRHPNYLWDQLAEDRLIAMVIADGHHLPDEVLRCFVRCKSPERLIAVSDMTGMGGMPPGRYDQTPLGAVEVLENGRLVVAGQRRFLAGAALPLWRAVERLVKATDMSFEQAIDACSFNPAKILGLLIEPIAEPGRCCAGLWKIESQADEPSEASHDSVSQKFTLTGHLRDGRIHWCT